MISVQCLKKSDLARFKNLYTDQQFVSLHMLNWTHDLYRKPKPKPKFPRHSGEIQCQKWLEAIKYRTIGQKCLKMEKKKLNLKKRKEKPKLFSESDFSESSHIDIGQVFPDHHANTRKQFGFTDQKCCFEVIVQYKAYFQYHKHIVCCYIDQND